VPLFVDPFGISQRPDPYSQDCHNTLVALFERVIQAIRTGDSSRARYLLGFLREPNETRLGLSRGRPRGAGIGPNQSAQLYEALAQSTAVKTGFLRSLEECELMIEGIAHDKISDLTTNIIRGHLAKYTLDQCNLLGIPTRRTALAPYYDADQDQWISSYFDLPVIGGSVLVLVPKAFVRLEPAYNHQHYYRHYVLEYLQREHLEVHSSLVTALKNGRRVVYKKDLEERYPCTKEFLFQFSMEHPEVLEQYRADLAKKERGGESVATFDDDELIATSLSEVLGSIPTGNDAASDYHKLIIGIVEFIFYPELLYPQKEREIHDGRKRIDIVMENGAKDGFFERLHTIRKLPASFVVFECKNYGSEVGNPELDQLTSRFSDQRGKIGFLCCRRFANRPRFINRCRDTFKDGRGLAIPLDDETLLRWLELIATGSRFKLDQEITQVADEIWMS
jgi:hypothetical protein